MKDGGAGMAGAGMQIAGNIFNEMVMEEAIKDKTVQVQKQLEDEAGNILGHAQDDEEDKNSDPDFDSDGDDKVMASLREQRIKEMKAQQQEMQDNMAKGHGHYSEIVEDEFLPTVTKT